MPSRLELSEKFLANNFALSDAQDRPLNGGDIADLPLLRTLLAIRQKSRQWSFWEVIDSFVLLAYASLAGSRTLFQRLLTCLNFTLDSEVFSVGTNEKRDFYNYGSSTNYWKPWRWMRINLILTMSDIYINYNLNPLTKFTSSSWNISHMITKTVPISKKIVVSYTMKGAYRLEFWWKVNGNWDNNMIRISQWRESHCRTTTSVRRER